jgi:hypothetical protein
MTLARGPDPDPVLVARPATRRARLLTLTAKLRILMEAMVVVLYRRLRPGLESRQR